MAVEITSNIHELCESNRGPPPAHWGEWHRVGIVAAFNLSYVNKRGGLAHSGIKSGDNGRAQ